MRTRLAIAIGITLLLILPLSAQRRGRFAGFGASLGAGASTPYNGQFTIVRLWYADYAFFSLKSLDVPYPGRLGENGLMGEFYSIHEGNDPANRLVVVINYNMDIGDYMEHSGRGWYSVAPTNGRSSSG